MVYCAELKIRIKRIVNKIGLFFFMTRLLHTRSFLKLINFTIRRHVLTRKIPAVAIIALTFRCNCRCAHCSAGLFGPGSRELSIEEWKHVIDQLDSLGVPRLHISGGEPTLKEGFEEIVGYACRKGMVVFLETNGSGLDLAAVRKLKRSGLASIDVSLDDIDAAVHDKLRGLSGSYEKALVLLRDCREAGIPHMVSTYATADSIYSGRLKRLIDFSRESGVCAVRILPPQPSGRWLGKLQFQLSEKDRQALRDLASVHVIIDRTRLPLCPIKNKHCVFIFSDGEIGPCPHLPFSFGNTRQISVEKALDRMVESPMFSETSVCYINAPEFNKKYIAPVLERRPALPVRV